MRSFLLNPKMASRRATLASLVLAFAMAALFYKFGSFALECIAFVATWAIIDLPAQWLAAIAKSSNLSAQSFPEI